MENNNEKNGFTYTYSAEEQAELKELREKYAPREESKMERLRRLDKQVAKKATAIAVIVGVIGALILGVGMSLAMSDFSAVLGAYEHLAMPLGIAIGVVGGILAGVAYPIYTAALRHERKKAAPEIIKLTDELIK